MDRDDREQGKSAEEHAGRCYTAVDPETEEAHACCDGLANTVRFTPKANPEIAIAVKGGAVRFTKHDRATHHWNQYTNSIRDAVALEFDGPCKPWISRPSPWAWVVHFLAAELNPQNLPFH